MVTYAQYNTFSPIKVTEEDFAFILERANDTLSLLCGRKWDPENEICQKATLYQIETIAKAGGLENWLSGKDAQGVGSYSYNVGNESESFTYYVKDKKESEQSKAFNGLAINPLAWQLLVNNGFLQTIRGVRVW